MSMAKISLQQSYSDEIDESSPYYVPEVHQGKIPANFFCRGWNGKRNKYCRAEAGRGTDHKGQGRCLNHGGSAPIKHGRYSSVPRGAVAELQAELELENEEDKMNIMPEATLMRALTGSLVEQFEDFIQGIIKFNDMEEEESQIEKRKPMYLKSPSLKDVIESLEKCAEVVNKIHKQRSANAISLKEFLRVQAVQAEIVRDTMDDLEVKLKLGPVQAELMQEAKLKIANKWKELKISNSIR